MKDFLPDGYRWANIFERRAHEKSQITGAMNIPVSRKNTTLTKRLAVPA